MVKKRLNQYPDVSFMFSPGLEFITALYRMANRQLFHETYADHHVEQDEEIVHMVGQMRDGLTPFLRRELDFFFQLEHSHADQAFHQLMFIPSAPESVSQLVTVIDETEPAELIGYLIEDVTDEELQQRVGRLWKEIEQDETVGPAKWAEDKASSIERRLVEAFSDMNETKQRFVNLVTAVYQRSYGRCEAELHQRATAAIPRFEELYSVAPKDFFHEYVGPDIENFDKQVRIHVSPLTQFGSFVSITGSPQVPHSIRLGINIEQARNRNSDVEMVDKFCKAISDKTRLEILRLLSGRAWYGQELAKRLELSPAAISYHMGFFYSVNLISMKRIDQKGYFVLDKERLQYLFGLLENTLGLK